MHYFRHGRTGDFVVKSPLVLGHEIAGEIVDIAADGTGPEDRRSGRSQPIAMVRTLRAMPGRASEPMREHLLSWVRRRRRRICRVALPRISTPSRPNASRSRTSTPMCRGSAGGTPRCLPSRRESGRPGGRPTRHRVRRRSDRSPDITGCSIGREYRKSPMVDVAAAPLAFAQRLGADHIVDISRGEGALKELAASQVLRRWPLRSPERPPDYRRRYSMCAAGARSSKSATCRAARSQCLPTRSWPGK